MRSIVVFQAFSNDEIEQTKETADLLKLYQTKLDKLWRSVRWATDVITYARDKANLGKRVVTNQTGSTHFYI